MGALPKQKVSRAAQGRRRAHQALAVPQLVNCTNCGNKIRPHRVCDVCGHYKDEQVIEVRQKKNNQ